MSAHTPGPWKIEPELFKYYFQITSENSKVASCHAGSNKQTDAKGDELYANARLIAAAPELLEALKWALRQMPEPSLPGVYTKRYCEARELIDRATGAAA